MTVVVRPIPTEHYGDVMKPHCAVAYSRPLMNPHAVAERLAIWADQARRSDRIQCADGLLVLAWDAYDRPDRAHLSNDNVPRNARNGTLS